MRIYVKIDNYPQIYDVYGTVVCDNNDMLIRVKDCGWNIVVRNVPNAKSIINELLSSDYTDLSSYAAYFLQYNNTAYSSECTDDNSPEKDLFEREL